MRALSVPSGPMAGLPGLPADPTAIRSSRERFARGRPLGRRSDVPILLALAAIAFLVRAIPVVRGGGFLGLVGYDDGVYFGSAIALVHGVLPYRDYLLLLPPGMAVGLAPFAWLGTLIGDPAAFAVARVSCMLLGSTTTVLIALTAGRYSRAAGIAAGALYAVWIAAAVGEHNTDLHALQNLLLVLALYVLSRPGRIGPRRASIVGVALGLATSVQLWQGLTVLIVLWWILVRARGRGWDRLRPGVAFLAGAGIAFGVVCLPFLIAAPEAMIRYVLLDQVSRPETGSPIIDRLRALDGLDLAPRLPHVIRRLESPWVVVTAAAGALALAVATARAFFWTRPWAVLAVAMTVVILLTPSFHGDYPSFVTPTAALVLGTGLAGAVAWLARRRASLGSAALVMVAILLVGMAGISVHRPTGTAVPLTSLERDLAGARCVSSDSPSLLILTSTLRRGLDAGCAIELDPGGVVYDTDRGHLSALAQMRKDAPGFQAAMIAWYTSGDAALFLPEAETQLSNDTMAAIKRHLPVERTHGNITVRLASVP